LLVDGHEDLALNVVSWGRDYLGSSALAIRGREHDCPDGLCMLGLEDWQAAGIGVVFATIAVIPEGHAFPGEQGYATPEEARAAALSQLEVYRRWDASDAPVRIVRSPGDLAGDGVALVLLMENADPIRDLDDLAFWRDAGVRIVGPAWHSNRFTGDTREPGPLTPLGREVIAAFDESGIALDLTHMAEEACFEALDLHDGAVCATHAHSRRTCDIERLLPDSLVRAIVERDGIVGVLPVNWALRAGWRRGDPRLPLSAAVDAVLQLCEVAGGARNVGIGTDFDGGQGAESAPEGIETIADLPKLGAALRAAGMSHADVDGVLGENWLRWLRAAL
jgi:membrane dipeptidase